MQYPYNSHSLANAWQAVQSPSRVSVRTAGEGSYLVDPASSHMLVSKEQQRLPQSISVRIYHYIKCLIK